MSDPVLHVRATATSSHHDARTPNADASRVPPQVIFSMTSTAGTSTGRYPQIFNALGQRLSAVEYLTSEHSVRSQSPRSTVRDSPNSSMRRTPRNPDPSLNTLAWRRYSNRASILEPQSDTSQHIYHVVCYLQPLFAKFYPHRIRELSMRIQFATPITLQYMALPWMFIQHPPGDRLDGRMASNTSNAFWWGDSG